MGNPIDRGKAPNIPGEFRKITPQEIQYRRNNHLCFKCGDKFTPAHKCKFGNLHFMIIEEDEEFLDAPGEQDEYTGNPGQAIDVSLHALTCAIQRKTITLEGSLKGEVVSILVDTGSSHSFISPKVANRVNLQAEKIGPLVATIADGSSLVSYAVCKGVKWQIQQYGFKFDLRVLDIGG